jgi:flagellar FliL protein
VSTTIVIDAETTPVPEPVWIAPKTRRKRTMLVAVVAGLIVLAGVGGGAYYLLWGAGTHGGAATAASKDAAPETYVDVPQMVVNLRVADGRARFLKLHFMLVATDAGKAESIKARLPLYLDALQPFLRELRPEDLNGSAAVYRLKEEMRARADDALGGGAVRDVLIQDLVQQ